jgi:hypothetical protein
MKPAKSEKALTGKVRAQGSGWEGFRGKVLKKYWIGLYDRGLNKEEQPVFLEPAFGFTLFLLCNLSAKF